MLRGDIARARGDLGYAEENFQEALSRFSVLQDRNHTARTLSALGAIRALEGDYHRAEEFQRLAVDTLPTDVGALTGLGYAQWYGGSPANAEASFTQALAWDAGAALAISGRGQVRAEMREYGAALVDLDQALSSGLPPDEEADARSARALALAGLGRSDEAEREMAEVRSRAPRARTLLRSARIAEMAARDDAAVRDLERALATRPPLSTAEERAARRMLAQLTNRSRPRKAG
jgi:tetratricopeptide (TPR) repeat protein